MVTWCKIDVYRERDSRSATVANGWLESPAIFECLKTVKWVLLCGGKIQSLHWINRKSFLKNKWSGKR